MKIWAHTIVRNEERYVWYAVMSVIEYVDKILIWDTGSEDETAKIIQEIKKLYPEKVEFKKVGKVTPEGYTKARQEMLEETLSDWFILVDGDEVWWEESIKELVDTISIKGRKLDSIVSRFTNAVGDIYHHQEEKAGRYEIDGEIGHLTIRAMNRKIPGLYTAKPHGQHGYFDGKDRLIQERDSKRRIFMKGASYLHLTHLPRSTDKNLDVNVPKRNIKLKYELGIPFPNDFYYPEVFFRPKPSFVPSPWEPMSKQFYCKALLMSPLRKVKRRIITGSSGY